MLKIMKLRDKDNGGKTMIKTNQIIVDYVA